jgi:DNA repair protein RadC
VQNSNIRIKDLPEGDRPREKLLSLGPETLADKELLAILIRCGSKNKSALDIAEDILNEYRTLKNIGGLPISELMKIKGIKKAKVINILVAFEIAKRLNHINFK